MPGPAKQFDPEAALAAAMEVFRARGYEAAGLNELLAAMGIGRKSLYDTFGNKRGLFLRAIDAYALGQRRALREVLGREGSPLGNITAALEAFAREHGRPGGLGCGIGNNIADFADDDAEVAAVLRGHLAGNEREWARAVRAAQAAGEVDPASSATDLARLLLLTAQGSALTARVAERPTVELAAARSLVSLLAAKP